MECVFVVGAGEHAAVGFAGVRYQVPGSIGERWQWPTARQQPRSNLAPSTQAKSVVQAAQADEDRFDQSQMQGIRLGEPEPGTFSLAVWASLPPENFAANADIKARPNRDYDGMRTVALSPYRISRLICSNLAHGSRVDNDGGPNICGLLSLVMVRVLRRYGLHRRRPGERQAVV